jgi:hypothetical protein
MGQNNCCTGANQKLLQNYQNEIIDFVVGQQGATKTKDYFNLLKEKVTTEFNNMPFSPFKERDYMKTL